MILEPRNATVTTFIGGFSSIHQASINTRNKLGAYIELFTDDLISHVAQKPLMDVVTVAFLAMLQWLANCSIEYSSF